MNFDLKNYFGGLIDWPSVLHKSVYVGIITILMILGLKSAGIFSGKLRLLFTFRQDDNELNKRAETLSSFIRYLLTFAIVAVGFMTILKQIGVEIGPILAGAGIVGLAVGFGAQNLVQDVISGFFILIEDQIRVGDVVEIKSKGGLVEKVGLRMTVLRDFSGNVHYIRNGQIDIVTNMTKVFSNYVFDIRISYHQDMDEVLAVIREIDEELRNDPNFKDIIIKPIETYCVDQFTDAGIIIKARTTTKPIRQWDVGREFNKRLKKKFDQRKIDFPSPRMTIRTDEDLNGFLGMLANGDGERRLSSSETARSKH